MWRKALGADGKRIIDIRVTENYGEVAKYVTKPGGYLELTDEEWCCDDEVLKTLHYGLARPRMIAWSRSPSRIRSPIIEVDTRQPSSYLLSIALLGKVPAVECDDGKVLLEAILTIEYLDRLRPKTGAEFLSGRNRGDRGLWLAGAGRIRCVALPRAQTNPGEKSHVT
jgi:hypothetical protein